VLPIMAAVWLVRWLFRKEERQPTAKAYGIAGAVYEWAIGAARSTPREASARRRSAHLARVERATP